MAEGIKPTVEDTAAPFPVTGVSIKSSHLTKKECFYFYLKGNHNIVRMS